MPLAQATKSNRGGKRHQRHRTCGDVRGCLKVEAARS
jgi:hypothetical protein